ncbi:hypothetical protein Syun_031662 [Stephania yunnanensis]|uniref:Uncharacterized protein n=1 Tax=Stephania yunnanensis TaxID=152371 RepID=A0AAP0HBJ4_9MAGN
MLNKMNVGIVALSLVVLALALNVDARNAFVFKRGDGVEKLLSDPSLPEKVHLFASDACHLLPKDLEVKCVEMLDSYANQAILFLQTYFSEKVLCNSTGIKRIWRIRLLIGLETVFPALHLRLLWYIFYAKHLKISNLRYLFDRSHLGEPLRSNGPVQIFTFQGMTTYEYVVAMRAMSEAPAGVGDEEMPNILYSPSGSATTGLSGGSSLGLQYKGAWCTPPRVFVDYQDEVIPHLEPGMLPSTVDPDAAGFAERGEKQPKKPVRISAWKLAKLDSSEAMRAAAKARASSSVLRPIDNQRLPAADMSSSENMSVRSSVSTDLGGNKDNKSDLKLSPLGNSSVPSQGSRDECDSGTHSMSSFSSPSHIRESVNLSPLPLDQPWRF